MIRSAILDNVNAKASFSGKVATGGRLNARAAPALVVPLTPSDLAATAAGATQVDLSWTDNSADRCPRRDLATTRTGLEHGLAPVPVLSVKGHIGPGGTAGAQRDPHQTGSVGHDSRAASVRTHGDPTT